MEPTTAKGVDHTKDLTPAPIRSAFATVICPDYFGSPVCIHCPEYHICEGMIARQRARNLGGHG